MYLEFGYIKVDSQYYFSSKLISMLRDVQLNTHFVQNPVLVHLILFIG